MNKGIALAIYYASLFSGINASDCSGYAQLIPGEDAPPCKIRKLDPQFSRANERIDRTLCDQVLALNIDNFLLENSEKLYRMPRSPRVVRSVYEDLLSEFTKLRINLLDLQKEADVLFCLDGYLAPLSEPNKEAISRLKQKCGQVKHGLACAPPQMQAFEENLQAVQALSGEK